MDSKEEDDVRVNVKQLVSVFREKELSGMSADSKYTGERWKSSRLTTSGSVSMRSEKSIEPPLVLKDKQLNSPQSTTNGSVSMRSEKSIEPPLVFKEERWKSPQWTTSGSVSMRSEKSIEPPFVFKDKQWKSPQLTTSRSVSMSSEKSFEPPFVFKDKQLKSPKWTSSGSVSMRSEKSIESPFVFKEEQWKSPQWTTSGNVSMKSEKSIESPLVFKDKQKWSSYGMPHAWGGRIMGPLDQPRLKDLWPPSAVYPVLRTDHRVPDDVIHSREKVDSPEPQSSPPEPFWDYAGTAESNITSDTSDYSGSRESQYDEETAVLDGIQEEVICDICSEAPAMKTCLTCSISYCEYDVRPHYKVKVLQRHTLIDVTAEFEGKRCHHYEERLDIFCRTDLMPICRICAQGSHKGHDIILQRMQHAAGRMCRADENQDRGLPDTVVPPPGKIKFLSVKPNSVVLNWGCPTGVDGPMSFRVKWNSFKRMEEYIVIKGFHRIEINNLEIGQQYFFSVATEDKDGNQSEWVKESVFTAVPAPRHLTKEHSEATALSLKWTKGDKLEQIPHQYLITVTSPGKEPQAIHTEDCYKMFSDLEPDTDYTISVLTLLNSHYSEPVSTTIHTDPRLMDMLSKIGLEDQYENKLTPNTVLEIDHDDTSESNLETAKSLPGAFLKKLMMLNANARSVKCLSCDMDSDKSNAINPLDLITALFLCSDSFFQQDIVQKMSLCQFAVPLLLPNSETREITMMLWAMREIVRTFRPSKEAFRKLNCEERLVHSDIPLVSFVRVGKMPSSKSEMLNKVLSNNQQQNETFYHRDMMCGDVPRRISDGLVEISWYLPCGNKNLDIFTEPVAIANLRGDVRAFDKQFSFLCETSAAVYIFCDESEAGYFKSLEGRVVKAKVFLISSNKGKNFTLKSMTLEPSLKTTNLSKKKTDAGLIKVIQESISKVIENCPDKVQLANLAEKARCNGILVDEHTDECQSARKDADKITMLIANTSEFKDEHLPSRGHIWKEISWLKNEWWRLRKVGNQNIENYRESLEKKEKKFRTKQQRFEMTAAMSDFLNGVVTSEVQRYYFLKWLEIDLDNLSRQQLSALQVHCKQQCLTIPQEKEQMEEIDKKMYACSLHLEHFFRECGQLYECASYLPEYSCQRKTMEQLPALCAQMLLDGFSIELVDGDAANIPMRWITEVLTKLHNMMNSSSKLKVIAVIGAENSGKSTLLNTMFGVKFATSRGSCSRGAFIQMINVNTDVREELKCDCILIIDTEGLKPHQTAQEDHSHERDREVASLAVALSDATIVSVSRDNSREEDILKIVLHAFTRLKDVGNKPLCHFVHTNMSDMSPVERKERDQELVEQLNEMIQRDTNLTKANITKISDVMEFDPDFCSWYLPAVWSGTPPMAPVSVEYSETVHALKKQLIGDLKKCQERGDLTHFAGRIECFWKGL